MTGSGKVRCLLCSSAPRQFHCPVLNATGVALLSLWQHSVSLPCTVYLLVVDPKRDRLCKYHAMGCYSLRCVLHFVKTQDGPIFSLLGQCPLLMACCCSLEECPGKAGCGIQCLLFSSNLVALGPAAEILFSRLW